MKTLMIALACLFLFSTANTSFAQTKCGEVVLPASPEETTAHLLDLLVARTSITQEEAEKVITREEAAKIAEKKDKRCDGGGWSKLFTEHIAFTTKVERTNATLASINNGILQNQFQTSTIYGINLKYEISPAGFMRHWYNLSPEAFDASHPKLSLLKSLTFSVEENYGNGGSVNAIPQTGPPLIKTSDQLSWTVGAKFTGCLSSNFLSGKSCSPN